MDVDIERGPISAKRPLKESAYALTAAQHWQSDVRVLDVDAQQLRCSVNVSSAE
jgi:hypothetical protein